MAHDKELAECAVLCNMIKKRVHQIYPDEQNVTELMEALALSFIEAMSEDFLREELEKRASI